MPRMFPVNCPVWSAEQRASGALEVSVALCFPSVSDTGKAEMPLAQSASRLGCCVGSVGGQCQSLPAHCCPVLGEQVSLFPAL